MTSNINRVDNRVLLIVFATIITAGLSQVSHSKQSLTIVFTSAQLFKQARIFFSLLFLENDTPDSRQDFFLWSQIRKKTIRSPMLAGIKRLPLHRYNQGSFALR